MERANLNFIWQRYLPAKRPVSYYYTKGEVWPGSMKKYFKDWLSQPKAFTPQGFSTWVQKNFTPLITEVTSHPCIYYNIEGLPAEYSYIFDQGYKSPPWGGVPWKEPHTVRVYEDDELIFTGPVDEFLTWLDKQQD